MREFPLKNLDKQEKFSYKGMKNRKATSIPYDA